MFTWTPEVDGETTKQNYRVAQYGSSAVIQIPTSLEIPQGFEKDVIHILFFYAEIFTVAAELKVFACTPSEVGAQARPL